MKQLAFPYAQEAKPRRLLVRDRDLPVGEQPLERLQRHGPGVLSTTELLAVLLRNHDSLALGQELLVRFGKEGLVGLSNASLAELSEVHGIGPVKAAQIKAALELGRRMLTPGREQLVVRSPADAANLLMMEMSALEQEELRVVMLDARNHLLGIHTAYKGSNHVMIVRGADLFREAVRASAAAIIAVHNHPSGDPTPSAEDVNITSILVKAGRALDLELLDHLIIGGNRFVSLKERGLGFGY